MGAETTRLSEMSNIKTLTEYARLLRCAWLNHSNRDAQIRVHDFERQHADKLQPLWTQWQKVEDFPSVEIYPETPPGGKSCCHSLPHGLHEFNCRAWRP